MKKTIATLFISSVLLALIGTPLLGQNLEKEKTYTHTIDAAAVTRLDIIHQRGPLHVQKSTDGQIHLDLLVRVSGKYEEDINLLFDAIEIEEEKKGSEVKVTSSSQITSWIQTLGKTRIKLKNGAEAKDIKNLEMILTVKTPAIENVGLKNKYEKIEIEEDFSNNLEVDLYSGELFTKNIGGSLILNSKYSTLQFGNFGRGVFDLYECKATGGAGANLDIHSKYSTVRLGKCQTLTLDSYEDKYTIDDIVQGLNISDKYSHFKIENIGDAQLDLYETEFEINTGKNLGVNCKYGTLRSKKLNRLELNESYETDFTIDQLDEFIAKNDKYGSFVIDHLTRRFMLKGYESSVDVREISSNLTEINIESKYDRMHFGIPVGLKYSLDAEMKYGKVTYEESLFDKTDRREKGDELIIKAGVDDPSRKAKVFIRAYETDFTLK